MATITSAQTGNFSSTSTWVGGVVPTSSDDAVAANGHVVTIDADVTVLSFQQAGTGKFVLGGGRTVTGNVIGNAGAYNTGGATVEVTATTGTTATINGNITGTGSTTQFSCGVLVSGLGTFILNGNVTGFSGNLGVTVGAPAIYTNVNCAITVNGTVAGGGNLKVGIFIDTSSSAVLTINGNITTGVGIGASVQVSGPSPVVHVTGNITALNSAGIAVAGTSPSINVTGNVSAGSGTSAHGINSTATAGTINVTGNVTGGFANNLRGISATGNSTSITITGDVTGRSNANSDGIVITGTSATVTVTGNVNAGTGGSGVFAAGIFANGASSVINVIGTTTANGFLSPGIVSSATGTNSGVVYQGNMIDGNQGAVAIYTRLFRITGTQTGYNQHQNTVGFPNGTPVFRVSPDQVTGMPVAANVRSGTVFGYSNQFTGTMAVPAPQSVSHGVPVDHTTGTASLRPEDIAALVGAHVAAGAKGVN